MSVSENKDFGARTDANDASDAGAVIEADSLVEEVSIDGMCGVY
ncbi:mycofactocin precursor MftA [Lacisediminihabitans profunda]|uniref:Mycofactocin n=1 Tax=Lacisediminihabitans profunda TaxID=2594790 RepID=A0A5C8US50_9MICO|nr:mycofactocin precursor MftA [Lacisediminihabitans profunda]TXN31355.1 mycofactocin precursor [Lacisediminihabitans profunda]